MALPARHISITINRPPEDVYAFAANPENLPEWAAGLVESTLSPCNDNSCDGEWWVTSSPMGEVKVKFTARNAFGVMDHDVMLPSGEINHNPFRVARNGEGSEVIFTLYRLPRMSDDDFLRDTGMVENDLQKLKLLLEI